MSGVQIPPFRRILMITQNDSDIFIRKARGAGISRQAHRVYLCFARENINDLNILIDDLLSYDAGMDCAVTWANALNEIDKDILQNELREMQVFIVFVTDEFLKSVNKNGIPVDFKLADDVGIPILPIAQDDGLLPVFTDIVSKLHGIAMNDPEYRTKLKAQLENFLTSEDLKKYIDSKAFTADVFLSYRKVDLDDAREFMKDLHNINGLQGISIWYDHFLTAGREFDLEIREAIENSKAFVLLVTPNITQKNNAGELNYVAREEVPFAVEKAKTIVPVEVKPRDAATFAVLFPNIGEPVSKAALNKAFREKLGEDAYIKSLGSERAYLLGMAYLRGYKVERDAERAVKLLETAAMASNKSALDAAEQLAKIYEDGFGSNYPINYGNALMWWQKACGLSERINGKKHQLTAAIYNKIGAVFNIIGDYTKALEFHNKAINIFIKIYGKEHTEVGITYSNIGKIYIKLNSSYKIGVLYDAFKIFHKNYGENHPYTAGIYLDIGIDYIENNTYMVLNYAEYKEYAYNSIVKALAIYKNIYGDKHYYTAIAHNYLGKVYILMGKYDEALENLNIALKTMNDIYGEEHLYSSFVYANLGLLYEYLKNNDKAFYYFDKVLKIQKKYFNEDNITITSLYNVIGSVYLRFEKYDEAMEYFIKDVEINKRNYENDKEKINYEKKSLKSYRLSDFFSYFLTHRLLFKLLIPFFIIIFIIVFPVLLLINIPNIIKSISSVVKIIFIKKKSKKYSSDNEIFDGLGHNVHTVLNFYSVMNYMDKHNIAIKILKEICEKYTIIADLYYKINDYENALKYYIPAMEMRRRAGKDKFFFGLDIDNNLAFNQKIGTAYFKLNDYHNALKYCNKALKFYNSMAKLQNQMMHDGIKRRKKADEEQEYENVIDNNLYNANIAELFNILGQIYFIQKKHQKSLEYFMKAIEIHKLLPCEDIDDTGNPEDYINSRSYNAMITIYSNIGKIHKETGEFDKALMNYNKALESFFYDKNDDNSGLNKITDEIIQLLDNNSEGKLSHLDTIMIYFGENIVSIKINKFDKTFNVNITINSDKNDDLAKLYAFAGNVYAKLNDKNKSDELYDKALLSYNSEIKNISEEDYEEQLKILKEKLAVEIKRYGYENIEIAKTYYSIGLVYKSLDNPEKRLEYYKKGLEIRIKVQGEEHTDTATQYNNVAVAYDSVGDSEKALEYHNKALSIRIKIYGEEHKTTALSYANTGYVYKDLNNYEKALEYFEKALEIRKKLFDADDQRIKKLQDSIKELTDKLNKT